MHEALIRNTHHDRLVGHLSRDSTAIEAREKPAAKEKTPPPPKRKRGRPKKGEQRPKVRKRLDRQAAMTLPAMLDDLPTDCDVGMKKDSKGYKSTWVGYKLHIDVADGQIPISCLLTSASLHDSQVAIPLATLSAERTTNEGVPPTVESRRRELLRYPTFRGSASAPSSSSSRCAFRIQRC